MRLGPHKKRQKLHPLAVELIKLFKNGEELTIRDIMEKLNMDRGSTRTLLDTVSLQIPIYEVGKKKAIYPGRKAPVYKLLDIKKL